MSFEEKTLIAVSIGTLMGKISDSDDVVAVIATCLDIWCNDHGEDATALASTLINALMDANGLEIDTEGDKE